MGSSLEEVLHIEYIELHVGGGLYHIFDISPLCFYVYCHGLPVDGQFSYFAYSTFPILTLFGCILATSHDVAPKENLLCFRETQVRDMSKICPVNMTKSVVPNWYLHIELLMVEIWLCT